MLAGVAILVAIAFVLVQIGLRVREERARDASGTRGKGRSGAERKAIVEARELENRFKAQQRLIAELKKPETLRAPKEYLETLAKMAGLANSGPLGNLKETVDALGQLGFEVGNGGGTKSIAKEIAATAAAVATGIPAALAAIRSGQVAAPTQTIRVEAPPPPRPRRSAPKEVPAPPPQALPEPAPESPPEEGTGPPTDGDQVAEAAPDVVEVPLSRESAYAIGELEKRTPAEAAAWLAGIPLFGVPEGVARLRATPEDKLDELLVGVQETNPALAGLAAWLRSRPEYAAELHRALRG